MSPAAFLAHFQAKAEELFKFVESKSDNDVQFKVRMHSTVLGDDYTTLERDALQLMKHKYKNGETLSWQVRPYLSSEEMRGERFAVLIFNISEGEKHGN